MKKLTLKLLALALACIMLLPMVIACTDEDDTEEPQTEAEKFDAMSEADKAFYLLEKGYEDGGKMSADLNVTLETTYSGYKVNAILSGKSVEINTGNTYIDYTEMTMSMTMAGNASVSTTKNGWIDGKFFIYTSYNGSDDGEGYYELMSKEDYIAEKEKEQGGFAENFGITKENCSTVTCTKNGYGNWVATFTDLNESGLTEFKLLVESFSGLVDPESLVDVEFTIVVTSDFKPLSISADFEFSGNNPPLLTLEGEYTIGNDVETPEIDLTGYQEIKDGITA